MPHAGRPRLAWNTFGEQIGSPELIPERDWFEIDYCHLASPIMDQDGRNACCGFASTQIVEAERRQEGLDEVDLSPGDLYARINGGRDQGALLEDALEELMRNGISTRATVHPLTVYQNQIDPRAAGERALYRMLEAWWCPTPQHVVSAVLRGFRVLGGVFWYDSDRPDSDGYLPTTEFGRRGGHAIPFFGVHKHRNQWWLGFPNSWGVGWGRRGWGYFPVGRLGDGSQNFGMWAMRSVVVPGKENAQPPLSAAA
jgi:hypothetical protein